MTASKDRTTDIRVKIERAKEHFGNLQSEISGSVSNGSVYEFVIDEDTDPQAIVYRVRVRKEAPLQRFGAMVGDVIYNLRTALDVLIRQLVLANGGTPTSSTIFPIASTPEEFKDKIGSAVQGIGQEAVDLIKEAKPYQGGNDLLFILNELDVENKRCVLQLAGGVICLLRSDPARTAALNERMGAGDLEVPLFQGVHPISLCPIDDNAEICRINRTQMNMDPLVGFFVAFCEPEIIKGKSIVEQVNELVNLVERFVEPCWPLLD